ncbi:MAG: hypothetical protein JSV85_02990 [Candidatus Bathyarchaeota archaeon]|nr:MAG: hypothetical protein JSV85_02990 [Candidatus Bathyarchaeota archaeon]
MTVERDLLVSVLQLTRTGPVDKTLASRCAHVPLQVADDMLKSFCDANLIQLRGKVIEASMDQRLRIAIQATRLGADFESVCNLLEWNEFEKIVAKTFEYNLFNVTRGFRFKWAERKWEVDVIGCREPIIVCADCKHWHRGWTRSAIAKATAAQVERTQALAEAFPGLHEKLGTTDWREATLVPMILSLLPAPFKFSENTPVVPILQLQDLLSELPAHVDSVTHFHVCSREK